MRAGARSRAFRDARSDPGIAAQAERLSGTDNKEPTPALASIMLSRRNPSL